MTAWRVMQCDGCDEEIDPDESWFGLDRFDPDLDDDPNDDAEYQYHFHTWHCVRRRAQKGD